MQLVGNTNVDRLMDYCAQDVRTEIEADVLLPELSPHERLVWELDQRINDRGVHIDVAFVERCAELTIVAKKRADSIIKVWTDRAVKKATETAKIVSWIQSRGIPCTSIKKGDQDEILEFAALFNDDLVAEVIELRRSAAKTSTAKFAKMLACVGSDHRMRGLLNYHGAGPGRWAGRLVQPQNFPRVNSDMDALTVEYVIRIVAQSARRYGLPDYSRYTSKEITAFVAEGVSSADIFEQHDMIEVGVGPVLPALSKSLRACITAAPGNHLIGGDFSNIEGRINAWLAGEHWKCEAFRQYDAGTGPDLYKVTAGRILGKNVEDITKNERQVQGKVPELACGYQGGVGAFITMGYTQNPPVKPRDLVAPVKAAATNEEWDATAIRYAKATDKFGLPEDQWTAIKYIVTSWRQRHPNIVQSWWDLQDAALAAVETPNETFFVYDGRVAYMSDGAWLYCRLPSGRIMHYCQPRIKETERVLVNKDGEEYIKWVRTVWFMGIDSTTRRWVPKYLYGGLQCENIVQGTARCVMDRAMLRVEARGYPLILTVHDEMLAEPPLTFGSASQFKALMVQKDEAWLDGLPLAAEAWEDVRYVK